MSTSPPNSASGSRLDRCIRDLAALNALPSMCIGRSPDETLQIVVDALPTALSCDLLYLSLPGSPPKVRASLAGAPLPDLRVAEFEAAIAGDSVKTGTVTLPGMGALHYLEADLPMGAQRGQLIAARATPFDPATDRVLVRAAANLVGTTLETANVLESARRKDDFLAMLGHELRNPLAPILTAVELLAHHPSVDRHRRVIERHTRHLARLVDDLLDISRVTHGNIQVRSEPVALASALERAVEMASPLLKRHSQSLEIASAEGVMIQGDPVRLTQIFSNLLTNAAKFTPPYGHIRVSLTEEAGRVRVTVRDNGRGLESAQIERIFEPFVQTEREGDALRGGLGLGLAIVKSLVERHGGAVSVKSAGPGKGSAFTVELPAVNAPALEPAEEHPVAAAERSRVRVLVVDDNVDVAELLSEALELEGFKTAVAHDAQAALVRWRTFVPHAAVLDVGLPVLNGYELARTVRAEHGAEPTLIAATGYALAKDRVLAAAAGFDCHFVKPVSVRDLVSVLDRCAARPSTPTPV